MEDDRNRHAQRLFNGIATQYDPFAEVFSFLQFGRWRRFLVSRLDAGPGDTVLDLCTGTAGVAMQTFRTYGCLVVGVDLSREMLWKAQRKACRAEMKEQIDLIMGRAEGLAFPDACFDAACFTYLLRYVDDPEATLREIARVLKPGGSLVSLEFGVPENSLARSLWYLYARGVLPVAAGLISRGWREVGAFLGPSVSRFYRSYPVERIQRMWMNVGIQDVQVRRLSLGGAVVMWGTKATGERS